METSDTTKKPDALGSVAANDLIAVRDFLAQRGLIIGKFMPLTTGHCHLIETALAQVRQLTILLGSLPDEPIAGHLRWNWLRDTFPQAKVFHCPEIVPQYPHQHPDFWSIWRELIGRYCGATDVVFSSETYGDRLAQELNARHVCVDLERQSVPISATQVRQNPLQNWSFIAPAARPYFVRRVLIYGPESTGKSTLSRQLAAHYDTGFVPEMARPLLEAKNNICEETDIPAIVVAQLAAEENAAREANKVLFCDTDVTTTTIYARHFFGHCPSWVQRIADERRYDLTLFTDIDLPWQDDPQRDPRHAEVIFRHEFRERFRRELESRRIPYVTILGVGEARLQNAIRAVDAFLNEEMGRRISSRG